MKKISYIIPIIALSLLLNIKSASADAYLVHLYYAAASKTLVFDKLAPQSISLDKTLSPSVIDFTQEAEVSSGPYILTFYDNTNNEIISTQFDKKDGAFQLTIPYFSIATTLKIFEKNTGKEILNADISNLSTCNGNGICEYEKGETVRNCIEDCSNSQPKFSQQTLDILNKNSGVINDPTTGTVLIQRDPISQAPVTQPNSSVQTNPAVQPIQIPLILLFSVIGLLVMGGVFFLYRKFILK